MGEAKEWLITAGMLLGIAVLAILGGMVLCAYYVVAIAFAFRWYLLAVAGAFLLWKIAERL